MYHLKKLNIKSNNFIRRVKNLLINNNNNRTQYHYRIILKNENLNKNIRNAIQLISLLLNKIKENVACLIIIIYKFNERNNINNEKFNKKSLLKASIVEFNKRNNINNEKFNKKLLLKASIETFIKKFNKKLIKISFTEKLLR